MDDVSTILTQKSYGRHTPKRYGDAKKRLANAGKPDFSCPRWLEYVFVCVIAVSCLGEDKTLNLRFGGLPKAITLAVVAMALLMLIINGELKRLQYIGKTSLTYLVYWGLLSLWSVILWVIDFSGTKAISRGVEKMGFQTIAIVVAIAAVFLFGERTIDLFAAGIFIANGMIAVLEMPNYGGPIASIQSLINLIVSLGDGDGYALAMEIHEVTFLYGMFLVYYLVFAPRGTKQEKRRNLIYIVLSYFFLFMGFKRLLILCIPLIAAIAWVIKKSKNPFKFLIAVGVFWIVFFIVFLYIVYSGYLAKLAESVGVNMMGRDYIWGLVKRYYRFSPSYLGKGFGTVDGVIVSELYHAGYLDKAYPLHNDILKVFIEFGFPGLLIWSGAQYLVFPLLLKRFFDLETVMLYMAVLSLMSTTYLTDNTAFYFWCMMTLRMIPLAYGIYRLGKAEENPIVLKEKWKPPSSADFQELVAETMEQRG